MKEENKKKPKINIFKVFLRLFPIIFRTYPFWFILTQFLSVAHGISWGVITFSTQRFFDSASMLVTGGAKMSSAVISLILMGMAHFISQLLNGFGNFVPQVYADKAIGKLQLLINSKMSRIPPICFENTEILDDINKANGGKNNAIWFVLTFTIVFTFYIPYFIFMSLYLFSLKPILAISLIIIFIPTLLTQILRSKIYSKLEDKSAPIRRQYDYYENCMVGREYFKETRLLGGFKFFIKLYKDALILLNQLSWKASLRTNIYEMLMKLLTLTGYLGILYMLFVALMNREISVGAFAAVFSSIGLLFGIMEEVVCGHFGRMAQNLGTIQNFLNFLDIEEHEGKDIPIDPNTDIVVKNATFSYPLAENYAVKNASFTIKKGETIAIVGENGSGKSTIVRLITGLYLPNEGEIKYGDIDTKNIAAENIHKNISGVFQKYQKYQMTLRENLYISDADIEPDENRLERASKEAGLDINNKSFDKGYDTMLSREFDGVDLSGGQWQRVAIARGFYRLHDIIVLDEPTAAIDPLEETKIYNRFAEISKDKTAIIVTHRLGSVKLADRIVVMDKGEVADVGTHLELIKRSRKYIEMWNAQAQYYQ